MEKMEAERENIGRIEKQKRKRIGKIKKTKNGSTEAKKQMEEITQNLQNTIQNAGRKLVECCAKRKEANGQKPIDRS